MPHKYEVGIKAVILNDSGDKVLFLTSKDNHGDEIITFPGGRMEEGENIQQTLKRELGEELNISGSFEIVRLLSANPRYFNQDNGYGLMLITVMLRTRMLEVKIDSEHLRYFWLGLGDIQGDLPLKIHGAILDNETYRESATIALRSIV